MDTADFAVVTEEMVARKGALVPRTIGHATATCSRIVTSAIVTDGEYDDVPWPCACVPIATLGYEIGFDRYTERTGGAMTEAPRTVVPTAIATEAEVIAFIRELGRKLEADDVTPALAAWATVYAKGYLDRVVAGTESPFAFMNDMCEAASTRRGGLSAGQAKGVLNTFRAGYWRTEMARKATATESVGEAAAGATVPDGKYTVVFEGGERRTIQVKTQAMGKSFRPGETLVSFLNGPDNWNNYKAFGTITPEGAFRPFRNHADATVLIDAVRVLMSDPKAAAGAYGIESGKCGICGRTLTVPESIEQGIGPVCLARVSW